ncbi:hypothetical protein San01_16160 [Streptomyces angustmyceticus]|uniref:Uncharacterized protein n=1 Tax=Streptomyces angustmyceticus TaxID=285578 RepID=A0A5J4LC17_9ACTN|nr:hypothetical protein San01_16160 [Streptomyces angustmyceticus]
MLSSSGFPTWRGLGGGTARRAYAEILPLRTRHIEGDVVLVPGVPDGYDPAGTAAKVREAAAAG